MQTEMMTLEQKIGQMFVGGFPGEEPSEEFIRLIEKRKLGNVILFSHNVKSIQQLAQLNAGLYERIEKETGVMPFITVDEEGGTVTRLPSDVAIMPSAMAQAAVGRMDWIKEGARIAGEQLKSLGINFNLAPILDINTNRNNPVIGVRSYGEDTKTVCVCAKEAVHGYKEVGILCSGKHFPGHGDTDTDSHLAVPILQKKLEELEKCELVPFCTMIEEKIPAITVSHMIVPALEENQIPCTMSRKVVTEYLREKLHFKGLAISDCMEMDAIKKYYGIENGVVAAVKAGMDLIFVSHTANVLEKSMEAVLCAVKSGEIQLEIIDQAVGRILKAKEKLPAVKILPENVATPEQKKFAQNFLEVSIKPKDIAENQEFILGNFPLFVGIEPVRITGAVSERKGKWDFAGSLKETFGGRAISLPLKPDNKLVQEVIEIAKVSDSIVIGTLNAYLYPEQRLLLTELSHIGKNIAHIALGNPYDLEEKTSAVFKVPLYEYSERTVEFLKSFFKKEKK